MCVEHEIGADGTLVVTCEHPHLPPDALFRYWIEPDLLRLWWTPEASVEPRIGGKYILRWPTMDWTLRGAITQFEPGRSLAFAWRWDHEPDTPGTAVTVGFTPVGVGSRIDLTHGPYPDSPRGDKMRTGHIEGWTHFLRNLRGVGLRPE